MFLLTTKKGETKGFSNFEHRFQAQLSKFNSHFVEREMFAALTAFLLLGNAIVDSSQRISSLAACSPQSVSVVDATDAFNTVSYDSVASIVRQCERPKLLVHLVH